MPFTFLRVVSCHAYYEVGDEHELGHALITAKLLLLLLQQAFFAGQRHVVSQESASSY